MKTIKHIALFLVIVSVILPLVSYAQNIPRTTSQAIELARANLLSSQNPDGSIGDGGASDWAAMALTAAGTNDSRFTSLKTYIIAQATRVDKNSATELERAILALTAVGVSPYNIGNRNLVDELKTLATDGQIGSPNLLNDDIFAILAFRAAGQDPVAEPFKNAIEFVQRNQLASGGFNDRVGGQEADIDITAVATVALSPYQNTSATKNFLIGIQNSDGGFPSRAGSTSNVSSTSWVIWAIGLKERAVEYLISQQQPTGSFGSILTTSYGLHALTGRNLPVAVVNQPAQPPVAKQPTQEPAEKKEQPQKPDVLPALPAASPRGEPAGRPVATPGGTQPVTTPEVTEPVKPAESSPKPLQRTQAPQKRVEIPSAEPAASVNQHSNLLLIAGAHPKETLAQTNFEAKTIDLPPLIQIKDEIGSTVNYGLAVGAVAFASILAIILLWRTIRPIELTPPPLALS